MILSGGQGGTLLGVGGSGGDGSIFMASISACCDGHRFAVGVWQAFDALAIGRQNRHAQITGLGIEYAADHADGLHIHHPQHVNQCIQLKLDAAVDDDGQATGDGIVGQHLLQFAADQL